MAWPTVTESRQADLKGFASTGMPALLIEREEIGIHGRANRRPTSAPTVYVTEMVGAWIIIDIQLCVPASRLVNVDVRETSLIGLFCWTVGWWEVFSRVARI